MRPAPTATTEGGLIRTLIPARLDRLPWSRTHNLIVAALGITWVLDGLEVTLTGAVSGVLQLPETLHLSSADIGLLASFYLVGAVVGALVFGDLTDRFGRKRLVFVTLAVYLLGVLLSAMSWNLTSFCAFRFLTGLGIGGEYAAINSAIDELIPARLRGRIDLYVNGSYWIGAAAGALSTTIILDSRLFPVDFGWRLGFGIGAVLGLVILGLRRLVPESPRWLITHGHADRAEATISAMEREIIQSTGTQLTIPDSSAAITLKPRKHPSLTETIATMVTLYPRRCLLGFALMASQAFLYNAIFFTYALVLTRFYVVPAGDAGLYLFPFAISNFLGTLALGALFDTIGRRPLITATYTLSAILLLLTGQLFASGHLTAATQTALWTLIFFFASPAASAAYLTVSEIFPLELRAMALAIFYAIGTAVGGVLAPWVFGILIGTGSRTQVFYGYAFAAVLMLAAAVLEAVYGIGAERRSLEEIAPPLSQSG